MTTTAISIAAILISIYSVYINKSNARKNIRLSIQQAIFKTVSEKVRDCNQLWESEFAKRKGLNETYYKVISEIIISQEIIDKSFQIFQKNYDTLFEYKKEYNYLFWKQLRTELRDFIRKAPELCKAVGNETYTQQISSIINRYQNHFE